MSITITVDCRLFNRSCSGTSDLKWNPNRSIKNQIQSMTQIFIKEVEDNDICVWCEKKTNPNIIAKGHAGVRGLCCHYLPRGCTWSCGIK